LHARKQVLASVLTLWFCTLSRRRSGDAGLVAERVDLIIADAVTAIAQIRGGTVKAYAVTSKTRMPAVPDIPTVDEAGLPTFHTSVWTGVWAPKGTPAAVIGKLNAAIVESLADPALRARIEQIGPEVVGREEQTPEALAALQKEPKSRSGGQLSRPPASKPSKTRQQSDRNSAVSTASQNGCFWHKADITIVLNHVRFRG
jgi:Tripartite tricarboxylate transporter family receptor